MRKYSLILCIILFLFIMVACVPSQKEITSIPKPEAKVEPNEAVKEQPKELSPPSQLVNEEGISPDLQELINKSKIRIKSIYYIYRSPETGNKYHEFYIKDKKMKYIPSRETLSLDRQDSYDVIFIDNVAKTAISYCEAPYCAYKGKKADLNYGDAYIQTIFDWINGVSKAKKVGEEVIDDRNTWKVETDLGIMWVDTFYGIPLKIEYGGKVYRFQQISVNSVRDSDVTPS